MGLKRVDVQIGLKFGLININNITIMLALRTSYGRQRELPSRMGAAIPVI
jgi:hypothetical protein